VNNPVNFALNSLRMLKETVKQVREFASRVQSLEWRDAAKLPDSARELERLESEVVSARWAPRSTSWSAS